MQIDAGMQQAAVANLESQRAARQADLQYARQQAARMKTLLEAGAASQAEMEQAQTALSTSEAQLKAAGGADPRAARRPRLPPGDRAHGGSAWATSRCGSGDSVTRSTVLTTIDQNAGLEVYINVPVQEAAEPEGRPARPPRRRPRPGRSSTETLSFVSPSVDARHPVGAGQGRLATAGGFRTEQFVRAADRLDGGAGADRAHRGPEPHQRPVLRLRGRAAARAERRWRASARWSRAPWSGTTTS